MVKRSLLLAYIDSLLLQFIFLLWIRFNIVIILLILDDYDIELDTTGVLVKLYANNQAIFDH